MIRSFICVEITNPDIVILLNNQISELGKYEGVRAVKPSQFHLTLKFLGEISTKQLESIQNTISQVKYSPFEIYLKGMGCFPNINRVRVIWIGISDGAEKLKQLAGFIEELLIPIGFIKDKRPFSPHLTLARVKYLKKDQKMALIHKIEELKELKIGTQNVDRVILKKSTLTPKGAIYENLLEVPFLEI